MLPEFRAEVLSRNTYRFLIVIMLLCSSTGQLYAEDIKDARELVRAAMEHWRGTNSYSEMTMTIHRSDWQRSMSMRSWSEGDKLSLVRVTEPKKDKGNGTLLKDNDMWSYAPKINRIIKIPSSMMSQGWMGSDFSNKDISKSTDILDQYDHSLISQSQQDGHTVYTIEAIPHEDAAIVWGQVGGRTGLSIGFRAIKEEPDKKNPMIRRLKEIQLFEYSVVTFPMNPQAGVTTIKARQNLLHQFLRQEIGFDKQRARLALINLKSLLWQTEPETHSENPGADIMETSLLHSMKTLLTNFKSI